MNGNAISNESDHCVTNQMGTTTLYSDHQGSLNKIHYNSNEHIEGATSFSFYSRSIFHSTIIIDKFCAINSATFLLPCLQIFHRMMNQLQFMVKMKLWSLLNMFRNILKHFHILKSTLLCID